MDDSDVTGRAVVACQKGDPDLLEECIADNLDVNAPDQEGCYLLHWAAINARDQICERLIQLGADVNCIGGILESTPLHWASRQGKLSTCSLLVRNGATCNVRDKQGYTPVHLAVQGQHQEVAAYLVGKFDYAKDFTDNAGMTPTMWAAYRCYGLFPIKIFIDEGANLNLQEDLLGNTALHLACQEGNDVALRLLLAGNADVTIKNRQHETALDLATTAQHKSIIRQLQREYRRRGLSKSSTLEKLFDNDQFLRRMEFSLPFIFFGIACGYFYSFNIAIASLLTISTLITIKLFLGRVYNHRFQMHQTLLPIGITVSEPTTMVFTWFFYLREEVPWWLQLSFIMIIFLLSYSFIKIVFGNPGVVSPSSKGIAGLVTAVDNNLKNPFCFTCCIEKTPEVKHCGTCNRCVRKFDHHCPWLKQCVTGKNMKWFLLFLMCVSMSSLIFLMGCVFFIHDDLLHRPIGVVLSKHCWVVLTGLLALVHVPLTGFMFCFHIAQVSSGQTTYSRMKRGHGHSHRNTHSEEHSDDDHSTSFTRRIQNILEVCETQEAVPIYNRDDDEHII